MRSCHTIEIENQVTKETWQFGAKYAGKRFHSTVVLVLSHYTFTL